jgi:hypothetical protein
MHWSHSASRTSFFSMKIRSTENMKVKVSKAVPLHAMEAHERRGGIAPTHT